MSNKNTQKKRRKVYKKAHNILKNNFPKGTLARVALTKKFAVKMETLTNINAKKRNIVTP